MRRGPHWSQNGGNPHGDGPLKSPWGWAPEVAVGLGT